MIDMTATDNGANWPDCDATAVMKMNVLDESAVYTNLIGKILDAFAVASNLFNNAFNVHCKLSLALLLHLYP